MNYGLRRLAELGVRPTQIRATGGGAKSKVWRQIMADIFNTEVVTVKVSDGAAYGAALQALWCWRLEQGDNVTIQDLTDRFVDQLQPVHIALGQIPSTRIQGQPATAPAEILDCAE